MNEKRTFTNNKEKDVEKIAYNLVKEIRSIASENMANKIDKNIMSISKGKDKRVLILFSGGADSVLLVEMAMELGYDTHCVLIDYGQLHSGEISVATNYLKRHPACSYQIVSIKGLDLNSALTGDGIQGRFGDKENISIWHVPGRNTIFAGIALSIAENLGYDSVWIGADYSDCLNKFPDCYQEYVVAMNKVYELGASKKISYDAPLLGMTKEMILEMLDIRGISIQNLFSGYGEITDKSK